MLLVGVLRFDSGGARTVPEAKVFALCSGDQVLQQRHRLSVTQGCAILWLRCSVLCLLAGSVKIMCVACVQCEASATLRLSSEVTVVVAIRKEIKDPSKSSQANQEDNIKGVKEPIMP